MADKTVIFDVLARSKSTGFDDTHKKINLLAVAAGALAVKFGVDSVKAYTEAEASQQKLQFAYAKFPKLADVSLSSLQKLNSAQALKTKYDDDETAAGEAVLAQYKLTGAQLTTLVPLMQDYAAKTGKDLPTAAGDLGRALLGNGRALKGIGVNFKDTGTQAGNFNELVGSLRTQVGGFATQEGKTAAGQAAILKNEFGEVEESVGKVAVVFGQKLLPPLIKTADFMQRNANVIVPLVAAVGGLAAAVWTVNKVSAAWTATQKALNIVLGATKVQATGAAAAEVAVGEAGAVAAGGSKLGALVGMLGKVGIALGTVVAAYQVYDAAQTGFKTKGLGAAQSEFDEVAQGAAKAGISVKDFATALTGASGPFDAMSGKLEQSGVLTKATRQELDNLRSTLGGMSKNEQADFIKQLGLTATATTTLSAASATAATNEGTLVAQLTALRGQALSSTTQLGSLNTALDTLSGNSIDAKQQELTLKDSMANMVTQAKANGTTLDENTAKGRANKEGLLTLIKGINDHAVSVGKQTGSVAKATGALKTDEAALRTSMTQAGYTKGQIDALIKSYAATPDQVSTKIKADIAKAKQDLWWIQHQIDELHGTAVDVNVTTIYRSQGQKNQQRASGGPVTAGTPYIVGEFRPEMFVPNTNGTIVPRVPSGGGASTGVPNIQIYVAGSVLSNEDLKRAMAKGLSEWAASGHTLPIAQAIR